MNELPPSVAPNTDYMKQQMAQDTARQLPILIGEGIVVVVLLFLFIKSFKHFDAKRNTIALVGSVGYWAALVAAVPKGDWGKGLILTYAGGIPWLIVLALTGTLPAGAVLYGGATLFGRQIGEWRYKQTHKNQPQSVAAPT